MELTKSNYFTPEMSMKYMSSSQFKSFMKCEACAMAEIRGEWRNEPTPAMLQGSFVDAYFEDNMEQFTAEHPEICKINSTDLLKKYVDLYTIINVIKSDPVLLRHCTGEQQRIMTGNINGVPFKIMIDSLLEDMTVDRKVMADFKGKWVNGEYKEWWGVYGYDIQAFIYQYIRSQNDDGKIKPFVLAVVTKEKQANKDLFVVGDDTLKNAGADIINLAPRYQAIKNGLILPRYCGECDYCKSIKKLKENEYKEI